MVEDGRLGKADDDCFWLTRFTSKLFELSLLAKLKLPVANYMSRKALIIIVILRVAIKQKLNKFPIDNFRSLSSNRHIPIWKDDPTMG